MSRNKSKQANAFLRIRRLLISCGVSLVALFYAWLGGHLFGVQLPSEESPVELYSTEMQHDLGVILCKAIDEAKSSVTLVIYTLTDRNIIKSLREKANSGALVKVICDAKTSPNIETLLGSQVKILRRYLKGLTHTKMLIIDEKQTWIGSANMTSESLRHYGNLVAAIDSAPLAAMASAKARSLTATERMQLLPHRIFPVGRQFVEMWFLPDDPRAISRIKGLIRNAQKSIRIAMFTWTRRDLANEVIAAKRRGVQVEIAIDQSAAAGAGAEITQMLLKGGIRVKLGNGSTLLHHKFMEIDHKILVTGSANWTMAAFSKNDDCFIVLEPLTEVQQKFMNDTWEIILQESSFAE